MVRVLEQGIKSKDTRGGKVRIPYRSHGKHHREVGGWWQVGAIEGFWNRFWRVIIAEEGGTGGKVRITVRITVRLTVMTIISVRVTVMMRIEHKDGLWFGTGAVRWLR